MIICVLIMREIWSLGDQGGSRSILIIFRWIVVPIAAICRLILFRILVDKLIRSCLRPGPSVGEVGRSIVRDDIAIWTMGFVLVPVFIQWPLLCRVVGVIRRTGNWFLIRAFVVIGPIRFRLVVPKYSIVY